jgi:hypothetical protein
MHRVIRLRLIQCCSTEFLHMGLPGLPVEHRAITLHVEAVTLHECIARGWVQHGGDEICLLRLKGAGPS